MNVGQSTDVEEARIRHVYARRQTGNRESWFNPAYQFMIQDRERNVLRLLAQHGFARLDDTRILEVGCGKGMWLRDFVKWGARPEHITGVDLLADRLVEARRVCPDGVTLMCANAAALDLPPASFDLVLQSTMFTSILDVGTRQAAAAEMIRVLRPGGLILWYDYHTDNPANRDARGVRKREIRELFCGCDMDLRRVTLAPPLVRALAPYSHLACQLLASIPLLRTHYLGAIRRPS